MPRVVTTSSAMRRVSLYFALVAFLCLWFADLSVFQPDGGNELSRMALGLVTPNFWSWQTLGKGLLITLAFAIQGVSLAAVAGFTFALLYRRRAIRLLCAFLRSVHELFWALLFMQVFGLSNLTALLALTLPYSGTLAKIYGELFEETDPSPKQSLSIRSKQTLSQFFYTTLPLAWPAMVSYTRYRLECGIRSSIVLGFVGLPTLGFYLDTAIKQGQYSDAAALLYTLILAIFCLRWWLRLKLIPIYVLAAFIFLPPVASVDWALFWQFFTVDLVPAPLRGATSVSFGEWLWRLSSSQIGPGLINTLLVGQIALVVTGVFALIWFPLNSPWFLPGWRQRLGDGLLIVVRTIPEVVLSFIGILLMGPSMLPAILALSIHNGAIIAHLVGGVSENLVLREDACQGVMRYAYEILPRVYRQFLAFLFYRWEIIMRETALLGILGIPTLGFYIDSAFEALFFDRALLLILVAAGLNMLVDQVAHTIRNRMHLKTTPESL